MTTIYDLPEPNSAQLARSLALSEYIRQVIQQQKRPLSFATFMELALYHPELGYYNADTFAIGDKGDFITAPHLSPLFAQCIARQVLQIATTKNQHDILELGAGSGQLAKDLLCELDKLGCLPQQYYIYEISNNLRKKQQDFLLAACPDFYSRIIWLDTLPINFTGTIIANEVLDALPVHCFKVEENTIKERCVAWDGKEFIWELHQPSSIAHLNSATILKDLYSFTNGYEFEINFHMQTFIKSLSKSLAQGIILLIDYGYGQNEYYHPQRNQGTLTCFYQHTRHNNPLILPGLQDITAHVDFTRVIETAIDNDCQLAGYTSQAAFLLACGLTELVIAEEKKLTPAEEFKLHHAVKVLTLPTEMGERIKVMALSKNVEANLIGFGLQDKRREL